MNLYQNPNFYGYQQPQINPYMQRIENLQQFQQAIQQPMVPTSMSGVNQQFIPLGKIVESVDIVKVTDIPMDGNMYYFPKADGTEIYIKQFGIDGKTRILTFKPILNDELNGMSVDEQKNHIDTLTEFLQNIQNDIKTISDKVDKIGKSSRTRKEVSEDE